MQGQRTCRSHGALAPQYLAAARQRLLMACDPVAARLVAIAKSTKTDPKDAIVAIREILNRAGVTAAPVADPAGEHLGQVLWEEFIQIHRRRVPELAD